MTTVTKTNGITYRLIATEEDMIDYRGHYCDENGEPDLELEAEIERRLANCDEWAWADVEVQAEARINGINYVGSAHLTCCSYRDAEEFMQPGGYYEGMVGTARRELLTKLADAAAHGKACEAVRSQIAELEGTNG